ncbi:MAG: 1,4-alpha-glucan branching protein GlgB [Vicinamibacterales bacterium]
MADTNSTLPPSAVDAVARGLHADPFAVLGPHVVADGLAVRVFRPHARDVRLVREGQPDLPLTRVHDAGFFEVVLPGQRLEGFGYQLTFAWPDGTTSTWDDPYRYGSAITDFDLHLFGEGTHQRAFERLGARVTTVGGASGVHFAVWAPNARRVSVVGQWNGWDGRVHPMRRLVPAGVWEIFIPGLGPGDPYKFEIVSPQGALLLKADPYGRQFEVPPKTASVVWDAPYEWGDAGWMTDRAGKDHWLREPMSIYEVHLGSWQRHPDGAFLSYRELADRLVPYVAEMGFTHIELLPIMEHPFLGSWGYQVVGFYAPTSRFGAPEDFKYFVDRCHQAGIGVLLDWVPGHFPKDLHGLGRFDGTALYEHEDPRQGEQQDWGTFVFNYGRNEVRGFLLSNALFWLEEFHLDGLRVDAVASMLYLDYSRKDGEWVPNAYGGRENLEAIAFMQQLNTMVGARCPGAIVVAEESTAWPGVSRPVHLGGLGFTYKWNMGWMHDMLDYCGQDPVYRKYHHNRITFSMLYAFSENFVLPFSHDEVVHGKRSLIDKMPGDAWQKHAGFRALLGYMFTHPGKKLLFMGGEIGQWREWNHDWQLDWEALGDARHAGLQRWVRDLNRCYAAERSLYEVDADPAGFQWIDPNDHDNSVISFVRRAADGEDATVVVVNFTPVPRYDYRIGVPAPGRWREALNSDAELYGGSNMGNGGGLDAAGPPSHGHAQSLALTVPPFGCLVLRPER